MSYRLTAERIGDTVVVEVDDGQRRGVIVMAAPDAVQFGWDLLALGAADAPELTAAMITEGSGH